MNKQTQIWVRRQIISNGKENPPNGSYLWEGKVMQSALLGQVPTV